MQFNATEGDSARTAAVARTLRRFRSWVVLAWIALAIILNVAIPWWRLAGSPVNAGWPQIDDAGAARRVAEAFPGTGTANEASVVVEGRNVTGDATGDYIAALIRKLRAETQAVRAVVDMGADPLTASIARSDDRGARFVRLWLAGGLGSNAGMASFAAVDHLVRDSAPPADDRVYLGGPAASAGADATSDDRHGVLVAIVVAVACAILAFIAAPTLRLAFAGLLVAIVAVAIALPVSTSFTQAGYTLSGIALSIAFAVGASVGSTRLMTTIHRRGQCTGRAADHAIELAFPTIAARVLGSAGLVAVTTVVPGWLGVVGIGAAVSAAGLSAVVASVLALSLAPGWAGRSCPRPQMLSKFLRIVSIRLYRFVFQRSASILTALAALAFAGAFVISATPFSLRQPGLEPPKVQLDAGDIVAARHFPDNRLHPQTVVITGRHDLRNPLGLIAIDEITRALMRLPGVTLAQSPTAPSGAPWPEATLAHQMSELNQQLQADGTSSGPLTSAITELPKSLERIDESISRLQMNINRLASGLTHLDQSLATMQSSVAEFDRTATTLANYTEPLRQFTGNFLDCDVDALCSGAQRILRPVDSIRGGMSQLTMSVAGLRSGFDSATLSVTSATHTVTELKNTLAQLKIDSEGLATAVRNLTPKIAQMSAFINVMADDLSNSGAGGFYLPTSAIGAESYKAVKDSLFSADGRSVRVFVYSTSTTPLAQLANDINIATTTAAKFGALSNRTVTVVGDAPVVRAVEARWYWDFRYALVCCVILLAATGFLIIGSLRLSFGAAFVTMCSYIVGFGLCVALWTYLLHIPVNSTAPLISLVIVSAVSGLDACRGIHRTRNTFARGRWRVMSARELGFSAIPVVCWALSTAMLLPPDAVPSQVAAVTAVSVLVSFVATRAVLVALIGIGARRTLAPSQTPTRS